jgi:hypothetical protein
VKVIVFLTVMICAGDRTTLPSASIETIQENKATQSLNAQQVQEYCQKLFHFKAIKVMRFK